jgi:hypothetical protein
MSDYATDSSKYNLPPQKNSENVLIPKAGLKTTGKVIILNV